MKKFDDYPKAFKKTIRYIYQDDLTVEQLENMQRIINATINKRKKQIYDQQVKNKVI